MKFEWIGTQYVGRQIAKFLFAEENFIFISISCKPFDFLGLAARYQQMYRNIIFVLIRQIQALCNPHIGFIILIINRKYNTFNYKGHFCF